MFIGRKDELRELQNIYGSEGFRIILVYGNAGSGKTTLIEEFCKDKDTVFFSAKKESSLASLNRFSKTVLEHYSDKETQPFTFWEHAFSYIKAKQRGKRLIVVLDNFSEMAERNIVLMNVLCNSADNDLKDSNILMILISGNDKFVQRYLLTNTEPLAKKISDKIYINKFLNDETVERLKAEAMKRSKGIDRQKFIRVHADEVIQREGETGSKMYKIVSGTAICYLNYGTEKEYLIGKFKEGASFGEYQLLTGKPAPYTMVAFTDMLLLRIGRGEFRKFIEMNTSNAVDIMRVQMKMIAALKLHVDMLVDEINDRTRN